MNDQKQKPGYYYEHENGSIHWKPEFVVDSAGGPFLYFQGPLVKRWWKVESVVCGREGPEDYD